MQIVGRRWLDHYAKIHFSVAHAGQHVLLDAVEQDELDARGLLFTPGDACGHQVGRQGRTAGHADLAGTRLHQACHVLQRLVEFFDQTPDADLERLPRLGQHHFAGGAIEQLQPQLQLQFDDGAADGRLRESDVVTRPAEVAALRNRQKYTQLAQGYIHAEESYIYLINQFLF